MFIVNSVSNIPELRRRDIFTPFFKMSPVLNQEYESCGKIKGKLFETPGVENKRDIT